MAPPKITSGTAKTINAAYAINSDKRCYLNLRPENVIFYVPRKCNEEIWSAVGNNVHSKDLALQDSTDIYSFRANS